MHDNKPNNFYIKHFCIICQIKKLQRLFDTFVPRGIFFGIVIPLELDRTTDSSNNKMNDNIMMLQACLSKNVKFIGNWSLLFLVNR
jgi:hypothetical protein